MTASPEYALLSNENGFTVFEYNGTRIRFRAPYSLERYVKIKKWHEGYLVTEAKYLHLDTPEEEYLDLIPLLEDLYIDPKEFLAPIRGVKLAYTQSQSARNQRPAE